MSARLFTWIVGSSNDADIVVRESAVSRRHCRLRLTAEGFRLEDLGSTNRTFVNGQPTTGEVSVRKADKITLGQNVPMPWPKLNLPNRTISIGRAGDNDIVLDFENVSSRHARLATAGETLTIEDAGSTNGIFVGNPPKRVKRAELGADETVRFGTLAVPVAQLLLKAFFPAELGSEPQSIPSTPETGQKTSTKASQFAGHGKETNQPNLIASDTLPRIPAWSYAVAGAAVCGIVLLLTLSRGAIQNTRSQSHAASTEQQSEYVAVAPTTPKPVEPSASAGDETIPPRSTNADVSLGGPLFLVVVSNPESREAYRLGTAWAVTPDILVTTASVAITLDKDAFRERFPEASVRETAKGLTHFVEKSEIHPLYLKLRQDAEDKIKKYEDAIEASKRPADGGKTNQLSEQDLRDQFTACISALERTVGYDVALLHFSKPVATETLQIANDSTPLRPKLKVTLRGLAFDREDPFFDARETIPLRELDARVATLPTADAKGPKHMVFEASAGHNEMSYLGSPIQAAAGQVLAMYSRPTPPPSPEDKVSGKTWDGVPWSSIREMIGTKQ